MKKQKVLYTYNGIFTLIGHGILIGITTWMSLENMTWREIDQSQKDNYCMIPLMPRGTQNAQNYKQSEKKTEKNRRCEGLEGAGLENNYI